MLLLAPLEVRSLGKLPAAVQLPLIRPKQAPTGTTPEISNNQNTTFGHGSSKKSSANLTSPSANSAQLTKADPELVKSFNGIDHRDQRLANGGNQFSLEPPDQGLCAGNGFVFETVNDALRIYNYSGKSLIPVTALNSFYGYPPAINRTTHVFGPELTDPTVTTTIRPNAGSISYLRLRPTPQLVLSQA